MNPLSRVGQHGNRGKNGVLETSRVSAAKGVGRSGMPRAVITRCNGLAGSEPGGCRTPSVATTADEAWRQQGGRARKAVGETCGLRLVLRPNA